MRRHRLPAELPNERVMSTVDAPALWHEIAALLTTLRGFLSGTTGSPSCLSYAGRCGYSRHALPFENFSHERLAAAILAARYDSVRTSFR